MAKSKRDTQALLKLIIDQKLDLSEYHALAPLIKGNFMIYKEGRGLENFTDCLIDAIIKWEQGQQTSSLEKLINENFIVWKRV